MTKKVENRDDDGYIECFNIKHIVMKINMIIIFNFLEKFSSQ